MGFARFHVCNFLFVEALITEVPLDIRILVDKTDVSSILTDLFASLSSTQILSLYATEDYVIDSFTRSFC